MIVVMAVMVTHGQRFIRDDYDKGWFACVCICVFVVTHGQWFIREVDDYNKGLDSIAVSVFVQNLRRVGLSTRVDLLHCTHPPCGNNQATYWRKIQPSNILERLAGGNGWMSTICSFIEIQFQCFVVGLNSLAGWSLCCDKQPVVTDSHLHVIELLLLRHAVQLCTDSHLLVLFVLLV